MRESDNDEREEYASAEKKIDFESVKRGDWVVVKYDSKFYPGKVSNKDENRMTECYEAMFPFWLDLALSER